MATPLQLVSDPEFQQLTPDNQQALLAKVDPDFGKLTPDNFNSVVGQLQKQALTRPDLVSPPAIQRPNLPMQESALGNAYSVAQTGSASNAAPASRGASLQQQTAGIENTTGGEVATGALNGALQTVHTGLAAGSRIVPGVQNIPFAEPKQLQSQGTAENIGEGLEGIGEFFTGDEAFKGLSLADRLGMASKVAKLAESHPVIAKIIEAGMNAVRSGAVSGAQSGAHNEDMGVGAGLGVVGSVLGDLPGITKEALNSRTLDALTQKAETAVRAKQVEAATNRKIAAAGVATAAHDAAEAAGAEVPGINFDGWVQHGGPSIYGGPDSFRGAADAIRKTFDPVFDKLRQATGGVLNPATGRFEGSMFDELNNQIRRAKKVIFSPTPASTSALKTAEEELADGQAKMEQLFNSNGQVSKQELATAKAAWKTASTLDELHGFIDKAFTEPAGVRGPVSRQLAEINPQKFVAKVNAAIDRIGAGNLKAALGDKSFADLMLIRNNMDTLVRDTRFTQDLQKGVRAYLKDHGISPIQKTFGGPAAGVGVGALAHLAGASNPVTGTLGGAAWAIHWVYTHPDKAVDIIKSIAPYVKPGAQLAAQGIKQAMITHVYNPATDQAEPVQ